MAPVAGGVSIVGVAAILLFNYFTGGNLGDAFQMIANLPTTTEQRQVTNQYDGNDAYEQFASTVLGSNNDEWNHVFSQNNKHYTPPKLVLFREATQSGCGVATSEVGPHYCPVDQTIYLDETFFDELTNRFGAKGGDVAQAYVISHEVGHHVQNLLGTLDTLNQADQQDANSISVKTELQADCFAGIWANSIKGEGVLEPGEINEAMDAAAAVGDDRIQEKVQGYVNPETWTHGSSQQRLQWFDRGYEQGTLSACDTFQ
jgi:predicted metalloprotease